VARDGSRGQSGRGERFDTSSCESPPAFKLFGEHSMLRINWQNQNLDVQRLIIRPGDWPAHGASLVTLANQAGVSIADERVDPQAGDFWLGIYPRSGWGNTDPAKIGWASIVEAPLAAEVLRQAA
jgi:hypothetical protein